MTARHIDTHIGCGDRIVSCGTQRLAESGAAHEVRQCNRRNNGTQTRDATRLIDENRARVAQADLPGRRCQRGPHATRHRPEHNQRPVLQDKGEPQGEHELRALTFIVSAQYLDTTDPCHQRAVNQHSERIEHGGGAEYGDVAPGGTADPRLETGADQSIEGKVHAQHQEFTLGKIDHPHDPENHREANAHQPVDRAERQTRCQSLQRALNNEREF